MVRRLYPIFVLIVLMVGCGSPSSQPTMPAQPVPEALPTGVTALTHVCKQLFDKGEVPGPNALADAIEILVATSPSADITQLFADLPLEAQCFRTSLSPASTSPLGIATLINTGHQSAILWRVDQQWRVAPGPGLGEYADIRVDRPINGVRELIIFGHYTGTGGIGSVAVLQYMDGAWDHQILVDRVSQFQGLIMDNDTLLVTGRNLRNEPLAWDANCCQPTNYQWLFQRQNGRFARTGERIVPDPYYTLNVFFGALQRRDTLWLSQVANPAATEAALRLGLDKPGLQITPPNNAADFGNLLEGERRYWDLLPTRLNKSKPSRTTLRVEIEISQGPTRSIVVNLKRTDGKWLVDSVSGSAAAP